MRPSANPSPAAQSSRSQPLQWQVWLALGAVILVSVMNWNWAWGAMFALWGAYAVWAGQIHFIEPVHRQRAPFLFFAIVATWILSGVYLILADLAPQWLQASGS